MSFASPHWLWFLAVLPLLYAYGARDARRSRERFRLFANEGVWQRIVPEIDWSARTRKLRVWVAAVGLIIVALARPQWGEHEETLQVSGLDLFIALDLSRSMEVEDVVPSRIKKAKHLARTLMDRLRGDRVGVVSFAASTHLSVPLTNDLDFVRESIEILDTRMMFNQGTDIGNALETVLRAMERGAEQDRETGADAGSRVVVLISDGEDHEAGALEAARKLKEAGVRLFVFGVGSQKGGPIPVRDESGQLRGYKKDSRGETVLSQFNPEALVKIAATAGGRYWSATPGEGEVDELLSELGTLDRSAYSERRFVIKEDRFQIFLLMGILLLLLESSIAARKARKTLPQGRVASVLAALFATLSFETAQASSVEVYLENQKGLRAYSEGKIEEARKHFGAAQALDPKTPQLRFTQVVVEAEQGDQEPAASSFGESASKALESNDPKLAASALYNLGVVQAKKGNFKEAVQAYLQGLDVAKASKNEALEREFRRNLELLQLMKQQQQKGGGQGKQDQQQDQQKQDSQQDQQSQQDQNQEQNQNQQDQQKPNDQDGDQQQQNQPRQYTRGQGFKSEKLSKEDAERVMSEISHKERELQRKLKSRKGSSGNQEKDW